MDGKPELTVDEYLWRYAVIDGKGNLDGAFVPISVAKLAVELYSKDKLLRLEYEHKKLNTPTKKKGNGI